MRLTDRGPENIMPLVIAIAGVELLKAFTIKVSNNSSNSNKTETAHSVHQGFIFLTKP